MSANNTEPDDMLQQVALESLTQRIPQIFGSDNITIKQIRKNANKPNLISKAEHGVLSISVPVIGHQLKAKSPSKLLSDQKKFGYDFLEVFTEDYRLCITDSEPLEIWNRLVPSQFSRAIKVNLTHSISAKNWIETLEESASQTYESRRVTYLIIVTGNQAKASADIAPHRTIKLEHRLSLHDTLLREKWVRSVVDGRRVALLAAKKARKDDESIYGLFSLGRLERARGGVLLPHLSMLEIFDMLVPRDMLMLVSATGDIFIVRKNASKYSPVTVFQKTQGLWHFVDYERTKRIIRKFVKNEGVAIAILASALDLSFERRGALFCIFKDSEVKNLFDDRSDSNLQVGNSLRNALVGHSVTDMNHDMLTAAATVDGAMIIRSDGIIQEVAYMLNFPVAGESQNSVQDAVPGSRTLAAVNASSIGAIVIKVSSDGQITVWENGVKKAQLGSE